MSVKMPKICHGVEGLICRIEADFLYNLPKRLGEGLYADLGTFCGRSALLLAGGLRDNNISGQVITVDTFDQRSVGDRFKLKDQETGEECSSTLWYARNKFMEKRLDYLIYIMRNPTVEAARLCKDKRFKFIFIDADHSYEGVKVDFDSWNPLLEDRGEIGFHDVDRPGVGQLMEELPDLGWEMTDYVFTLKTWTKR